MILPSHLKLFSEKYRVEYCELAEQLFNDLFPICRSITGNGVRETFKILEQHIPLQKMEIPSGTQIYDWNVPDEWNIRDAYIKNSRGERIVDFKKNNLHIVNYSVPVHGTFTLDQLKPHLQTLPELPDAIPYLTSYYNKSWGFCLSHNQLTSLREDNYEVCIDSTLGPGSMTLAECYLPPTNSNSDEKEILLSTYCCHPSMANNELSGPVLSTLLFKYLSDLPSRRYGYRFFFGIETIGSLAYLRKYGEYFKNKLEAGFVLTCCADPGGFTYKQTRNAENKLNPLVAHILKHSKVNYKIKPFFPTGADERQYCSPGFNLPVGSIMRTMYTEYKEYHTSLDNLSFVSTDAIFDTFLIYATTLWAIENNQRFLNLKPFGEPQLGKRSLYENIGAQKKDLNFKEILDIF